MSAEARGAKGSSAYALDELMQFESRAAENSHLGQQQTERKSGRVGSPPDGADKRKIPFEKQSY